MVAAKLVHRDFENAIAGFGDAVNPAGQARSRSSVRLTA
jgi:hypothetical protein